MTSGQGAVYDKERGELQLYLITTKINLKKLIEGGFTSKIKLKNWFEESSEICTHRPSPSS